MTGREYFEKIRNLIDVKESLKRRKDELEAALTAIGGIRYDKEDIQMSIANDRMADKVIELADLTVEYTESLIRVNEAVIEADRRLSDMQSSTCARILRMKYLMDSRHSFGWIGDELGYTERQIKRLHKKGIEEFERSFLKECEA